MRYSKSLQFHIEEIIRYFREKYWYTSDNGVKVVGNIRWTGVWFIALLAYHEYHWETSNVVLTFITFRILMTLTMRRTASSAWVETMSQKRRHIAHALQVYRSVVQHHWGSLPSFSAVFRAHLDVFFHKRNKQGFGAALTLRLLIYCSLNIQCQTVCGTLNSTGIKDQGQSFLKREWEAEVSTSQK